MAGGEKESDEMDMLGFLRLRAWDATREQEKKKPRQRFIDESLAGDETIAFQLPVQRTIIHR